MTTTAAPARTRIALNKFQRDALIAALDAQSLRASASDNESMQRYANIAVSASFHLTSVLRSDFNRVALLRVLDAPFNSRALDDLRAQLDASLARDPFVKMTRKTFYVSIDSRYVADLI